MYNPNSNNYTNQQQYGSAGFDNTNTMQQQQQGYPQQQQQQQQGFPQQQQQQQPMMMMGPAATATPPPSAAALAPQNLLPPAAPLATDENGLRWTWSSFPLTSKPKATSTISSVFKSFSKGSGDISTNLASSGAGGIGAANGGSSTASASAAAAASSSSSSVGDAHHIPINEEMVVPLAAMYTPLHTSDSIVRTSAAPINCRQCGAYLSVAAQVDFTGNYWACPCCLTRNSLPPLTGNAVSALPSAYGTGGNANHNNSTAAAVAVAAALRGSTVEYGCGVPDPASRQVYVFIIDTAVEADELDALRKQLLRTIDMMPPEAYVCCVTFGRGVTIWDLGCEAVNRCYTIRGNRTFSNNTSSKASSDVGSLVLGMASAALGGGGASSPTSSGIGGGGGPGLHKVDLSTSAGYIRAMLSIHRDNPVSGRFFVPLEQCEFALTSIIEELSVDPFPVPSGLRPERATGTALDVGATLLENLVAEGVGVSAKILLFIGGPATRGPGAVVGLHKGQMMRSHRDFLDYNTPLYDKAYEFYNDVERRLSAVGGSVDCFVASFDQTGIMELRECVNRTGGVFVCGDTFMHVMFEESLQRYFSDRDFQGKKSRALLLDASQQQQQQQQQQQENNNNNNEQHRIAFCGFNATFDIFTSRDTLISGAIGPCRAFNNVIASAGAAPSSAAAGSSGSPSSPTAAQMAAFAGSATRAHLPPIPDAARRVSPISIGEGNTQRWVASSVDAGVTITFLFDTGVLEPGATAASTLHHHQRERFVQFVTHYTTPSGERRTRVTSVTHHISPSPATDPSYFTRQVQQQTVTTATQHTTEGGEAATQQQQQTVVTVPMPIFDQTCAATVVSRMAVSMLEDYAPHMWETSKRWLDRLLVMFIKRFGTYQAGAPESLRLSPTLSLFPSFMYNLRRSEFFMIMNISPDETVFTRHWLMREGCDRSVLMIQPTLHAYTFAAPYATPVPLDTNSIQPDNILLIDCFFNVHIIRGQTIEEWRKLNYHENPDYQHFADLLAAPERDAAATLASRFPYPRFSSAHIDHGEARHLKTRLNPSSTHNNSGGGGGGTFQQGGAFVKNPNSGSILHTDDASIAQFMQTLKEAVVRSDGKSSNH